MLTPEEKKEKRRIYFAKWYSKPENKKKQNMRSSSWLKNPKEKEWLKKWYKKRYPPRYISTTKERFFNFVDKKEEFVCWEWNGYRLPGGYGRVSYNKETIYAHRLSFILHKGDVPMGMHVLHTCDNPSCVNPNHLWLGTAKDNAVDREEKGRGWSQKKKSYPQKNSLA